LDGSFNFLEHLRKPEKTEKTCDTQNRDDRILIDARAVQNGDHSIRDKSQKICPQLHTKRTWIFEVFIPIGDRIHPFGEKRR